MSPLCEGGLVRQGLGDDDDSAEEDETGVEYEYKDGSIMPLGVMLVQKLQLNKKTEKKNGK